MDIQDVIDFFSQALAHQVTQWTIAFTIAAWVHSGRVKREIKDQMSGLSLAITDLGQALRQDLTSQSERIGKIENGFGTLDNRLKKIETKGG